MSSDENPTVVLPYGGESPDFGTFTFCGDRSALIGRATIGERSVFGACATVRADGNLIRIGDAFCLGPRSTVHISRRHPTLISKSVAIGANCVIHACTIGHDVAIEDNVVILDGATIGNNSLILEGSVVFPRAELEPGGLWQGLPARRVRAVERKEIENAARQMRLVETVPEPAGIFGATGLDACLFVAPTARVVGNVLAAEQSSIWFGCNLDAGKSAIAIGARSNVQDNCEVHCPQGPVTIGPDVVIGHNVRLESCTIGEGSLIGNGAFVRAGTIVEPGSLVAAGAVTEPGQRIEGGWIWGGRPARALSQLTPERQKQTASTCAHYIVYATDYRSQPQK